MFWRTIRKIKNSKPITATFLKICTLAKFFVGYVNIVLIKEAGDAKNVIKFYNTFPHLINELYTPNHWNPLMYAVR
jgi:hypothetical protein